jgi:hypothetical protein
VVHDLAAEGPGRRRAAVSRVEDVVEGAVAE